MRLGGLGRNHDPGSILRSLQGDGLPDAAAGAGNKNGLAGKFTEKRNSYELTLPSLGLSPPAHCWQSLNGQVPWPNG